MSQWDGIRRSAGKNLLLKLLALVLALTLWFHISRTGKEYFSLTIPVTVTNLPDRLELKNSLPDQVTLTLSGPPGLGNRIHPNNLSILLDGRSLRSGRQTIPIKRSMINLPSAVSIVRIAPRTVSLTLMPLFRKTVPILPQFIGGDRITPLRIRISPDHALVEGDSMALSVLHSVKTRPIELSRLTGDRQQKFEITLAAPTISQARILSPLSVIVTVNPVKHSGKIRRKK